MSASMTTDRDESGVYHIDGPPYRGFVLEHEGQRVAVVYQTVAFIGASENEVRAGWDNLLSFIRAELHSLWLLERTGNDTTLDLHHKIVWWRRRPQFVKDHESDRWKFTARLATTPELPPEFWNRWSIPEGDFARNIKELL